VVGRADGGERIVLVQPVLHRRPARRAVRGRAREGPPATRRATRGLAGPLRPLRQGPDDRGRPPAVPAHEGPVGFSRGGEGPRGRGDHPPRGRRALRPRERPPLSRAAPADGAGRAQARVHRPPHRLRRLVSGLLLRDLGALYSAERNGSSAALPAAASYRDYLAADGDTGGGSETARGRGLLGQPLRGLCSGRGASPRPATAHCHVLPRRPGERLPSPSKSRAS
jgi:hypothetical protein